MKTRQAIRSAALAVALAGISTTSLAGSLPGFRQIGCWNKVVATCDGSDVNARAMCQHDGFANCNRTFEENGSVSLERIRAALPSVTSNRVVVLHSATTVDMLPPVR